MSYLMDTKPFSHSSKTLQMKISIIGAGHVGSSAAFAIVLQRLASRIILVDVNAALAAAQAEDLSHAAPMSNPVQVHAGETAEIAGSNIVILACGVGQKPGENRLQLLERNASIFANVSRSVVQYAPDAVVLIASNPVDLMTYVVARAGGIPASRVIGSGTILDTARFRTLLSAHLGISPHSVHAYVLGEHGDSEVLAWSTATIGGAPLETYAGQVGVALGDDIRRRIDEGVRRAAYTIIAGKGATYYGIGAGLARIVRALRDDERAMMTVSVLDPASAYTIPLSLPRIVGAGGILSTFHPTLSEDEQSALERSAEALQSAAKGLG